MKTKEEVLSIIKTKPNGNIEEFNFKKKFPELYQELSTWNFPSDFKFTQKLFHYFNDDPELKLGLCPVCGKRCKFTKFNKGYQKHCSRECSVVDKNVRYKIEQTCLEKYGVSNPMKSIEIRSKMEETMFQKYGIKHALQCDGFKNKARETCLEKYGVLYAAQNEDIQLKSIQTCQQEYGIDYVFQSDKVKNKIKETCIKKYGVDNYTKTIECQDKMKNTCIYRYGVDNYAKTQNWLDKTIQTCNNKYNSDFYVQCSDFKEKSIITCVEKYGYEHYVQSPGFAKYHRKQIEYDSLTFDSSWEVTVYQYCKENNIPCEYQPNITFEYEYGGKEHYYHPDFLINGKLYEVKGNHFFDGDKMINPYDRTQDGLYEAKHQCMIKNNIIILKENDIKIASYTK